MSANPDAAVATPTDMATGGAPAGLIPIGTRPSIPDYLRGMWRYREFAITVPLGELKARNADTLLGSLWHLLNPLLLVAVYYFVFGVVFDARKGDPNYIGTLLTGLFVFHYTSKALLSGARTITSNLNLIRSVYFPRGVLPLSSVAAEALAHVPAIAAMFVLVMLTGERPNMMWPLVLAVFAMQTVFNLGLSFFVGRITVHFRDVVNILPFVVRTLMYTSGVFFAADRVPPGIVRTIFELNPVYTYIQLTRLALLEGTTDPHLWLLATGWAVGFLLVGFLYFRGFETEYSHG